MGHRCVCKVRESLHTTTNCGTQTPTLDEKTSTGQLKLNPPPTLKDLSLLIPYLHKFWQNLCNFAM